MNDGSYNCTIQEALSYSFVLKETAKLFIGLCLFSIYVRLIYILLRNQQIFSDVFYKLVVMNGFAVGLNHF